MEFPTLKFLLKDFLMRISKKRFNAVVRSRRKCRNFTS